MSDAEAFMWNIERDPGLSSTFGALSILERPASVGHLRARLSHAVARIPRLRERVEPSPSRFGTPVWAPDPDFDLGHHLRRVALPAPGTPEMLYEEAARLVADPLDRTRPLWQFWCIEGLADGRGALLTKLHHSVADGEGTVRLAEQYMDFEEPDFAEPHSGEPVPAEPDLVEPGLVELDLAPVIAAALEDARTEGTGNPSAGPAGLLASGVRRYTELVRRATGEMALNVADPGRVPERGGDLVRLVRHLAAELDPGTGAGSPLWRSRSRRRHLEVVSTTLAALKAGAARHAATLNDVFLAAVAEGASRYHAELDVAVECFRATFAVSTRTSASSGNAFTPARIELPAAPMPVAERIAAIAAASTVAKEQVDGAGLMATVAPLASRLPASVLARITRQQAAASDFATSNLRAPPIPVWVGGARVEEIYALGPLTGTAFNVTLLSYCDRVDVGLHIDPVAVTDPARLRRCVDEGMRSVVDGR
jgi:diacylglycerol O-acyltransferase / wax synthase